MYYKPIEDIPGRFYQVIEDVVNNHEWLANDANFMMVDVYVGFKTQFGQNVEEKIRLGTPSGSNIIRYYLDKMYNGKAPIYFRYDVCCKYFTMSYNHYIMTDIPGYGAMPTKILDILNHIKGTNTFQKLNFHQLIEVAIFQTHRKGSGMLAHVMGKLKYVYAGLPILASAGFMFEEDYEDFDFKIIEKTADKLEKCGFIEINGLTGSEESIDMIYYPSKTAFKDLSRRPNFNKMKGDV